MVFCTIGDNAMGPTTLYSTGARNIGQGMQAHQVRRLVILSIFGVLGETARDLRGAALLFLAKRLIRHTMADHRRSLEEIQDHAPEWIAVRPLPLTNGLGNTGLPSMAFPRRAVTSRGPMLLISCCDKRPTTAI